MNSLKIKERQVGDVTVLDMDGEMRIGESGVVFSYTIHRLLEERRRRILLNLKGVTYIDSSGLDPGCVPQQSFCEEFSLCL